MKILTNIILFAFILTALSVNASSGVSMQNNDCHSSMEILDNSSKMDMQDCQTDMCISCFTMINSSPTIVKSQEIIAFIKTNNSQNYFSIYPKIDTPPPTV